MPMQITELLGRVRSGDGAASEELMNLVHGELHRIARSHLRKERRGHTLRPTALVNEAYLRLFQPALPEFVDRSHFLALASRIMRRILVDYARRRAADRRGGDDVLVDASDVVEFAHDPGLEPFQLLDLDLALEALAKENPGAAGVIEMCYFGGMTAQETAEASDRSIHVVQHDLRFGRAWLRRRLSSRS